ncbi:MAG: hypothetical protein ABEI52_05435 [Halobacteriaceae archaeon]
MRTDELIATIVVLIVSASFPFYIYGAWYILNREMVTWSILRRHLFYVGVGLTLNTAPVVFWMVPRLLGQLGGVAAFHAFFGVQAYAFLTFALTGIIRIIQVKRRFNQYHDPNPDVAVNELHEHMPAWRRRLRIGVAGYVACWMVAYFIGIYRYLELY